MSEPEFLISVLDRHEDWAVIICLVGGGQEINTGEAGLPEWFCAINKSFPDWNVFVSKRLEDKEYTDGKDIYSMILENQLTIKNALHLSVSIRSFRSEKLAAFVKALLELDQKKAQSIFDELKRDYPIFITRELATAKSWLSAKARGGEGKGIITSSNAYRLKPYGIYVKSEINPIHWFLNDSDDIRSSGFLEDVATEFDIQGLELDWTCIAWDANLRKKEDSWEYKNFKGTKWQNINKKDKQRYLLNSYRVLLTRARQGMIFFYPRRRF